jgi:POT family proton-dependent oligopeptide transporter
MGLRTCCGSIKPPFGPAACADAIDSPVTPSTHTGTNARYRRPIISQNTPAAAIAGFFVYAISGRYAVDGRVSSWFMVGGYGLNALGELLVSGLGLAMIARYVPAHMSGFMMGAFFVATGVSQYLGSVVANFAQLPAHQLDPVQSLPLYTKLFDGLGWLAAGGAVLAVLLLPLMRRLSREHQRCAEERREAGVVAVAE